LNGHPLLPSEEGSRGNGRHFDEPLEVIIVGRGGGAGACVMEFSLKLPLANAPSSVVCEDREETVESGADEEDHPGRPMHEERHFDPTKSRAELE
jgi:hypothetical protein